MHEGGLGHNILDQALRLARAQGITRVDNIHVRLGGLRPVEPDSVQFHFAHEAEGTPAEGAHLKLELVLPTVQCRACGQSENAEQFKATCSRCGSDDLEVIVAPELEVVGIKCAESAVISRGGAE